MYSDPTGTIGIVTMIVAVFVSIVAGVLLGNVHRADIASRTVDSILNDINQTSFTATQAQELISNITRKYNTDKASVGKIYFDDDHARIKNSYLVTSVDDRLLISAIIRKTQKDGQYVTNRSMQSLSAEWFIHNVSSVFLPNRKSQSDHVDLDYEFNNNQFDTKIVTIIAILLGLY